MYFVFLLRIKASATKSLACDCVNIILLLMDNLVKIGDYMAKG